MIQARDITWVAGFIEGEGSFSGHRDSPMVQAVQVQRWPLERLQALLGGTICPVRRSHKGDYWKWSACGVRAAGIMMTLYGLMSPRRREQITVALGRWRSRPILAKYRNGCRAGHPYGEHTMHNQNGRRCRLCEYARETRRFVARTGRLPDMRATKSRKLSDEIKTAIRAQVGA